MVGTALAGVDAQARMSRLRWPQVVRSQSSARDIVTRISRAC